MYPDDVKQAWQSQSTQSRLTMDMDLITNEVQRNQQNFESTIFWRDVGEVGTSLVLIPIWLFMGIGLSFPWTWYLMLPGLIWIACFMLRDRKRHRQNPPEPGEPLRQRVQCSLAQVEHQIWLLENILWWYLLPLGLPMLAFLGQVAWMTNESGWWALISGLLMFAIIGIAFGFVYWLNQAAVRSGLLPRRQELETILTCLRDEASETN